jgi:hypothetical protein
MPLSTSTAKERGVGWHLRALEESHEEAGHVQCYRVEDHEATKPLVQLGWEYAWLSLSCLR